MKKSKTNFIENIAKIGLGIFFLLFSFIRLYNIGAAILGITSIVILPKLKQEYVALTKADRNLLKLFLAYGITLLLLNLLHQNPIKEFEYALKFLLIIPVFLLFQKISIKPIHIFILIMASTIISASVGYYNYTHYTWASRATVVGLNTIHYGGIMQMFAFISIIGLNLVEGIKDKTSKYLYIILVTVSFSLGIILSILSSSRGVWLALPFQLLLIVIFYFKDYKRQTIILGLSIFLILSSLYFIPQTGIKKRIQKTTSSLKSYKVGNSKTSSGLRIEMYKFSLELAKEKPFFGTSSKEIKEKQAELPVPKIMGLPHFHNHYLDNLAHYGIVGLLFLLAVYSLSFLAFRDRYINSNLGIKSLGMVGILLLSSYAIYDVTDLIFRRNSGLLLFSILISILCSKDKKYE